MDFKKLSVASKVIIISAILAAVFLGSSFGYIIYRTQNELSKTTQIILGQEVDNEAVKIRTITSELRKTLIALYGTPPIQGVIRARANDGIDIEENSTLEQWQTRLSAIFVAEVNSRGYFDQLRYIDENGNEVVRVNNVDGNAVVITGASLQNKSSSQYFKQAMQTPKGEVFVSKTELNREGPTAEISKPLKIVIRYAIPVFDEISGERKGILIANVLLNKLINLSDFKAYEESTIYIYDKDGYFILHPDISKELGNLENLNTGYTALQEFSDFNPISLTGSQGTFETGKDLYVYDTVLPDTADPSSVWTILEVIPKKVVFADIQRISIYASMIGFASFLILLFVFIIVVNRILSPLKDLSKAADEIGKGNFNNKVKIVSEDEIGKLGIAFNNMVAQLQVMYAGLEKQVKERTEELAAKLAETEKMNQMMVDRELKMVELKDKIDELETKNNA